MIVKPLKDADFEKVILDANGYPRCVKHGAMNKITRDGIWRCISAHGYIEVINSSNPKAKGRKELDSICNAGCVIQ